MIICVKNVILDKPKKTDALTDDSIMYKDSILNILKHLSDFTY